MKVNEITKKGESIMADIRGIVSQLVGIRLDVTKAAQWLKVQGVEFETATDEIEAAIEMLYKAENSLGSAHQNLLISNATLKHISAENDK